MWNAFGARRQERPTTKQDYGQCAAFWGAWMRKAVDARRVPQQAGVLGDELIGRGGRVHAETWKIMADLDLTALAAREQALPLAEGAVDKALGGDVGTMRGLMGVLGTCAIIPK